MRELPVARGQAASALRTAIALSTAYREERPAEFQAILADAIQADGIVGVTVAMAALVDYVRSDPDGLARDRGADLVEAFALGLAVHEPMANAD